MDTERPPSTEQHDRLVAQWEAKRPLHVQLQLGALHSFGCSSSESGGHGWFPPIGPDGGPRGEVLQRMMRRREEEDDDEEEEEGEEEEVVEMSRMRKVASG